MTQANHIINKLGGLTSTANISGRPYSTVQTWQRSGWIHPRNYQEILDGARAAGRDDFTERDFVAFLDEPPTKQ